MATDLGETVLTVKTSERTWRTEIESPLGAVPSITAHRETVRAAGGNVISRASGIQVGRSFADLGDDSVTVAGKSYSAKEIAAVIPAFIDKWRSEDIAAAAKQPALAAVLPATLAQKS
jgi:hypothetical protein